MPHQLGSGRDSTGAARSASSDGLDAADRGATERERLLQAARQVMNRNGWWGFKIEVVLNEARLSTRSFYRHFDTKNDLLLALLQHELDAAGRQLRRELAGIDDPIERVRKYISMIIDMAYDEKRSKPSSMFASHWREMANAYPDAVRASHDGLIAPLAEALQAAAQRGAVTSSDPAEDARLVFYLVASTTADEARLGGSTPRAEMERGCLPLIYRALGLE